MFESLLLPLFIALNTYVYRLDVKLDCTLDKGLLDAFMSRVMCKWNRCQSDADIVHLFSLLYRYEKCVRRLVEIT